MLRVDLESDGMPVKVMAAFGALPATTDAWALTRRRAALASMATGELLLRKSDSRVMCSVKCEVWKWS